MSIQIEEEEWEWIKRKGKSMEEDREKIEGKTEREREFKEEDRVMPLCRNRVETNFDSDIQEKLLWRPIIEERVEKEKRYGQRE